MAMVVAEDVTSPTFESLIGSWPGTSQLSKAALARQYPKRRFTLGWRIPAADLGLPEPLIVALEREDAFQVPRIAVERRPEPCEMPHLESDGVFCLLPSSTPIRLPVTGELAVYLVEAAVKVYSDALTGANRNDYLDEFGTYWTLDCTAERGVYVWLRDFLQTRTVYALNMANSVMVADSIEDVEGWMKKLGRPVKCRDIGRAVFVRLNGPLYPEDYPSNSSELLRLLFHRCPEAVEKVLTSIRLGEDLVVVWCFEHDAQPVMGATITQVQHQFPHPANRGQAFLSGRNRVRVPANVLTNRLSQAKFPSKRASVVRVDSEFLVRRTAGEVADAVKRLNVVVVGCGALGATVALLLAQAGVRNMTLIDGDVLTYQNVGRHILGAQYIGRNKAEALRDEINARYVDYAVLALASKWQLARDANQRLFEKADLVISATGDWLSEAELNAGLEVGDVPPTIFAWLERYGVAGHATFVSADASLQWALNEYGEAMCQVAKVPGETPREAACGAFYQPFSAAASAEVASMTVSLALAAAASEVTTGQTWTWIGPYENLLKTGAEILPAWRRLVFDGPGFQKVYRNQLNPPSNEAALQR
jgi:hypothetical protein